MNIDWKLVLKIVTGIIIVPITIIANALWNWWQKTSLPLKIISAPLVLPLAGIAYATSFWWNDL